MVIAVAAFAAVILWAMSEWLCTGAANFSAFDALACEDGVSLTAGSKAPLGIKEGLRRSYDQLSLRTGKRSPPRVPAIAPTILGDTPQLLSRGDKHDEFAIRAKGYRRNAREVTRRRWVVLCEDEGRSNPEKLKAAKQGGHFFALARCAAHTEIPFKLALKKRGRDMTIDHAENN